MAHSGWSSNRLAFVDDRDWRARHAFADLQRARDLADIVDDAVVEADIVEQRRGARRRADADDAGAFFLQIAQHREQAQLRQHARRA